MKKIISILLSVCMLAVMFTAYPLADGVYNPGDTPTGVPDIRFGDTSTVPVSIEIGGSTQHRYAVVITFDAMEFTYSTGSAWDTIQHIYNPDGTGTWSGEGTVSIENHSDLPIKYTVDPTLNDAGAAYSWLTLGVTSNNATGEIEACAVAADPVPVDVECAAGGTPNIAQLSRTVIGDVTVTIERVTAPPTP